MVDRPGHIGYIPTAMLDVQPHTQLVAARLFDFFGKTMPWQRRRWGCGAILALHEVLETSEAVSAGVLSRGTLGSVVRRATEQIGRDPAAATGEQKRLIGDLLKPGPDLRFQGMEYRQLAGLLGPLRDGYLVRWRDALVGPNVPTVERTARAIASHALDSGFNADFLHRWLTYHVEHDQTTHTLASLTEALDGLVKAPPKNFKVLVPFKAGANRSGTSEADWLSAQEVSTWLEQRGVEVSQLRQVGGLLIQQSARDAAAAVELAYEVIERIGARARVGARMDLRIVGRAWIDGDPNEHQIGPIRRGVEVGALRRENQIYRIDGSSKVDAALDLAGLLDHGTPAAAVAGGWASVEALLTGPGDGERRAVAGSRLATIIACSFPRAELTALSYAIAKAHPRHALTAELAECTSNLERCDRVAKAVVERSVPHLESHSDVASLLRMEQLAREPRRYLREIESYVDHAVQRLYRQRNLVLHWGRMDAVALRATLRTVAPLIGAGLDRVVHAWFVDRTEPLELAAIANTRLNLAEASGGIPLQLLEKPRA